MVILCQTLYYSSYKGPEPATPAARATPLKFAEPKNRGCHKVPSQVPGGTANRRGTSVFHDSMCGANTVSCAHEVFYEYLGCIENGQPAPWNGATRRIFRGESKACAWRQILRRPDGRPRLSASAVVARPVLVSQGFAWPFQVLEPSAAARPVCSGDAVRAAAMGRGPHGNHGVAVGHPQGRWLRFTADEVALAISSSVGLRSFHTSPQGWSAGSSCSQSFGSCTAFASSLTIGCDWFRMAVLIFEGSVKMPPHLLFVVASSGLLAEKTGPQAWLQWHAMRFWIVTSYELAGTKWKATTMQRHWPSTPAELSPKIKASGMRIMRIRTGLHLVPCRLGRGHAESQKELPAKADCPLCGVART